MKAHKKWCMQHPIEMARSPIEFLKLPHYVIVSLHKRLQEIYREQHQRPEEQCHLLTSNVQVGAERPFSSLLSACNVLGAAMHSLIQIDDPFFRKNPYRITIVNFWSEYLIL
jgi:hypothetical protein